MKERLYSLLPLIFREQDYKQRQPLRGIMAVLQTAHDSVSDDISLMYENWFIETCEESRIPYIADLVGTTDVDAESFIPSERRYVANYLAYKRRKGTQNTLCNAMLDSSGYNIYAISENEKMAMSWCAKDPSLQPTTFNISGDAGALMGTPFHKSSMMADFRTNSNNLLNAQRGRGNINTVSIYVWRLEALPVRRAQLTPCAEDENGFYISPFEGVIQLCSQPYYLYNKNENLTYSDYPMQLNRNNYNLLGQSDSVEEYSSVQFYEYQDELNAYVMIEASKVDVADLSTWHPVRNTRARVLIDPNLGRVYTQDKSLSGRLYISYSYLSTTVFGAGPFNPNATHCPAKTIRVAQDTKNPGWVETLSQSIEQWKNNSHDNVAATISLEDSVIYENTRSIEIELNGVDFTLVSGDNAQPVIDGKIIFTNSSASLARITLQGLTIIGELEFSGAVEVNIEASTLISKTRSPLTTDSHSTKDKHFNIKKSLVKGREWPDESYICAEDSVFVFSSEAYANSSVSLLRTTVLGHINCFEAPKIKDSLITGQLTAKKASTCNILYSYANKFNIGPGAVLDRVVSRAEDQYARLHFRSTKISAGEFAMLREQTDTVILNGASNGDEMGVFNILRLRLREHKIKNRIEQYLPTGLDAQLIYIN